MNAYVVEYHRVSGEYRVEEFAGDGAGERAIGRRLELERRHAPGDGWEIVSLNAESLDVLKRTHSRYFFGRELVKA